jgi:hypothetical protein
MVYLQIFSAALLFADSLILVYRCCILSFAKFGTIGKEEQCKYQHRYLLSCLLSTMVFCFIILCFSFAPISTRFIGLLRFLPFYILVICIAMLGKNAKFKSGKNEQHFLNMRFAEFSIIISVTILAANLIFLMIASSR